MTTPANFGWNIGWKDPPCLSMCPTADATVASSTTPPLIKLGFKTFVAVLARRTRSSTSTSGGVFATSPSRHPDSISWARPRMTHTLPSPATFRSSMDKHKTLNGSVLGNPGPHSVASSYFGLSGSINAGPRRGPVVKCLMHCHAL